MSSVEENDLASQMQAVLRDNDMGSFTVPAQGIYPHQWLWDSCFIAIGMRHYDLERAQTEILSLLRGQWKNGMLPHMVLSSTHRSVRDGNIWRSWVNPYSPDDAATSGMTQPPMLAEAVMRIGEKMKQPERRTWYKTVFPALLAYHQWIYLDRDPHEEGLALQTHPWETGFDNTPPWMSELKEHKLPFWIRAVRALRLQPIINMIRRDIHTHHIPAEERMDIIEALALYHMQRRLRRKMYDTQRALTHSLLIIEDLGFNCILVRANSCLQKIAKTIGQELPIELLASISKTEESLEKLWDEYSGQYFSRDFVTHKLIKEPTIATLLPLYAGSIAKLRAEHLVKMLKSNKLFGDLSSHDTKLGAAQGANEERSEAVRDGTATEHQSSEQSDVSESTGGVASSAGQQDGAVRVVRWPVPSVPLNSEWFKARGYWQGPTWINTNWLIIDGLRRYGFNEEADILTAKTIQLVEQNGPNEYFSPIDGTPSGADNFSWTAALTIDLLKS